MREDGYLHCQDCLYCGVCHLLDLAGIPFEDQLSSDEAWEYCENFYCIRSNG